MRNPTLYGILAIVLLVASITAAYAMWSETLKVNVEVSTGEVDVKWSDWSCNDNGADPQAPRFNNSEGKDVASCNVSVERMDDEGNAIKLLVVLNNTYPGYAVDIDLVVDNIGTIPVKLYNYSINGTQSSSLTTNAIKAVLDIPEDTQIHPGGNSTYTLRIAILQGAEENETYTFEIVLTFAQWNEVP